jgi:uncharacterized protein YchJ
MSKYKCVCATQCSEYVPGTILAQPPVRILRSNVCAFSHTVLQYVAYYVPVAARTGTT